MSFIGKGAAHEVDFCERQLNLLAHAQAIELEIGSRCGGHGVCGGDRVQVVSGSQQAPGPLLSPLTESERQHLSAEEIEQGFRLACQCFPESSQAALEVHFF
ncbi:MAG: hypothetical protein RJB38_1730 [Pseudomonadota bacterium]